MSDNRTFKKLFESGYIGQLHIKNRIVMPAMATGTSTPDGFVTQKTKDYYENRASGGAGLVIVEYTCIDFPRGQGSALQLAVDDDKFIPGLSQLAKVIQSHGAKAALQLHHAGNAAFQHITKLQPVGPSAIARPGGDIPRALSEDEISDVIELFARAAKRAMNAGFDGVEIHGAHSYLIAQFLSSAWNCREDRYGGTLENRTRIFVEIFQAVRDRVGKLYPVWCRINGEETGIPGGTTREEAKKISRILEPYCDAISVSTADITYTSSKPYFFPPGWAAHLAAGVKETIHRPVIGVGRITPELAEHLLQERKLDFIAMGRALRADPELPNKLYLGKLKDIRPCIVCSDCVGTARPNGERLCAVNPEIGREGLYKIEQVPIKKRVLIVGGGPAGMEAARVAALRGHKVTLWEKGDRLGGKLLLAAIPPFKEEITKLINFLSSQITNSGVKVKLQKEGTSALVRNYKPDVLILATGSIPLLPRVKGIDSLNAVTAEDVLGNRVNIGNCVAILGGGQVGCEVAAFLLEKGKKVTIVEMLSLMASDLGKRQGRDFLINYLTERGVTLLTLTKGEEISEKGLMVVNQYGQKSIIEADTVVLACGAIPHADLLQGVDGHITEVHTVGDCTKTGKILGAIDEGARIARII